MDGQNLGDIAYKYSVQSYPTFVYVQPNSRGLKAVVYRDDRTYDDMKAWMQEIMGPAPALGTGEVSSEVSE